MLRLEFNHKYKQLFTTNRRYIHLWGGRGRGGSYTATQYALHLITQPQFFRGYLMREVAEDIRESLWRDFKDRIEGGELEDQVYTNDSSMTAFCAETGNHLMSKGFKKSSGKRTAKLKSLAGATHVFIEEAEEISEEDFNQLDDTLRTTKADVQIVLIFNPPPKNHWIWKRWYNLIDTDIKDSDGNSFFRAEPKNLGTLLSIFGTYKDNEVNMNQTTIANFMDYETSNPEHYYTMILGLISEGMKGRIYRNWKPIEKMPGLYSKFYGLDWGFNDPVALVECEKHNQDLYADELIYESGLTNDVLSKRMEDMGIPKSARIFADSANPKDIEDLRRMGWNIRGAKKGPGSVVAGVRFIKKFNVYLTEKSRNLWHEAQNYRWRLDQHKNPTDEPEDKNNHGMDALNYATEHLRVGAGFMGATIIKR